MLCQYSKSSNCFPFTRNNSQSSFHNFQNLYNPALSYISNFLSFLSFFPLPFAIQQTPRSRLCTCRSLSGTSFLCSHVISPLSSFMPLLNFTSPTLNIHNGTLHPVTLFLLTQPLLFSLCFHMVCIFFITHLPIDFKPHVFVEFCLCGCNTSA